MSFKFIKAAFRPLKRLALGFIYISYDGYRYLIHSSTLRKVWADYKLIKIYHRLEKSLSFKGRNKSSGWNAAKDLVAILENTEKLTYQGEVALKVLNDFVNESEGNELGKQKALSVLNNSGVDLSETPGGVESLESEFLLKGKLENPEKFFFSRYSARTFASSPVSKDEVLRAIKLASKTPSVCNRQSWAVYHIGTPELIRKALRLQNGNTGFTQEVRNLLIVATDLRAFEGEAERFQNWIDGGIYTMSIVYALHSIGISSCILNLCNSPSNDRKLRRLINAPAEYSFITMIAFGHPSNELKVCVSARTPIENYFHYL